MDSIHWLDDGEYKKALFHVRGQLRDVFKVFDLYGQGIFIEGAIEETIQIMEDYGLVVRGVDKPIMLSRKMNPR